MPNFVPLDPDALVELIGERCLGFGGRARVAIDGPPAAKPQALAERTAGWLRQSGRPAAVVDLEDFQLPASQQLEYGRDPESYASHWFDYQALRREVLNPMAPKAQGPAWWLPRLRDARADRSVRDGRRKALPDMIILVAGPMLLGQWLDFELSVALSMDRTVLERRTPPESRFTLPALVHHQLELDADIIVRYNHADRPAVHVVR